jgi:hypothetical protein
MVVPLISRIYVGLFIILSPALSFHFNFTETLITQLFIVVIASSISHFFLRLTRWTSHALPHADCVFADDKFMYFWRPSVQFLPIQLNASLQLWFKDNHARDITSCNFIK